jgi:hypothetical protein
MLKGKNKKKLSSWEKKILRKVNYFAKPSFQELKKEFRKQADIIIENIHDYNELKEGALEDRGLMPKDQFMSILQKTISKVSN